MSDFLFADKKTPHFRYLLGVFCLWCHKQHRAYFLSLPEHHGHHHHHHHHYCLVQLDLEPIWVIWFHTSWLDNDLHARCRVGNRDRSGQEEAFYVLRGRMKSVMHTEPVVYTQKHGMDFFEKLWPWLNELTKVGIHISGGFTNAWSSVKPNTGHVTKSSQ